MGGSRCTYRNCTVRTDGTTHMFHYPVFDKVRCHQWLTSAQKHEFLNLKVSQLKNRVVCQNHFKNECFMNFKKDRLTFEAIPTLDGPFCDPGQYEDKNNSEVAQIYPISLDDIETEHLTLTDKKANFSVKYGDFLTNCDMMATDPVNIISINDTLASNKNINIEESSLITLTEDIDKFQTSTTTIDISLNKSRNTTNKMQHLLTIPTLTMYQLVNPTVVDIEFDDLHLNPNNQNEKPIINNNSNNVTQVIKQKNCAKKHNKTEVVKEQRVKIISEKKINEPVPLTGKLEPVSPSLILHLPAKRNKKSKSPENGSMINVKDENRASYVNVLNNNTANPLPSNEVAITRNQKQSNKSPVQTNRRVLKNTGNNEISPNKSLLKPKINRDRVAAIKEKRKFNMKLRDIIETCLDKIDEQDSEQKDKKGKKKTNEQVGTFLSKQPDLPSIQEYTIACLEARMKRMEDLLLNKIDQNTHQIMELKNSLLTSDKKPAFTQTTSNEESHKKQLYKDISKYLSADANSLIYEELFINKYAQNASRSAPSPKRRRRRL